MAWVGVALILAGGVLVYSAWKGLSPVDEFKAVITTGKTQKGTAVGNAPTTATNQAVLV